MCQQQFETEVQAEQYPYWKTESFEKSMAESIASNALAAIRKYPKLSSLNEWYEGRISAVALIFPNVLTISAKNEARFLAGEYARRVRGML